MSDIETLKAYYKSCVKMYGPSLTEYQKGILQGIECAMSLIKKSN